MFEQIIHIIISTTNEYSGLMSAISLLSLFYELLRKYRNKQTSREKKYKLQEGIHDKELKNKTHQNEKNEENHKVNWKICYNSNKSSLCLVNKSGKDVLDSVKLYKVIYHDDEFTTSFAELNKHYLSFINKLNMTISKSNMNKLVLYKINKIKFHRKLENYFHLGDVEGYIHFVKKNINPYPNIHMKRPKYIFEFGRNQELTLYFHGIHHPNYYHTLIFKRIDGFNEKYCLLNN